MLGLLFAFILIASGGAQSGLSQASAPQSRISGFVSSTSLADTHLSKTLRLKIERDLDWQDMEKEDRAETERMSTVSELSFPATDGHPLRHVLRISGGGPPCGRGGNCPELLYDATSGARLLKSDGFNLLFLKTKHAGALDLQIDDSIGPSEIFHTVYRFDGSVYRQLRRVKYCCDD